MADEDELYLANLDEFVNDENRIVTYKWLSRTLSVPANKAKQMLYAFVQKQKGSKSGSDLNITYIIGGRCSMDGDIVQRFVITQDENLEETKRNFSLVTSLHIYSIQKCRLKDLNSLYTVDYDVQQQHENASNRWSHIHCSAAVPLADKGANRGTTSMNGVTDGDKGVSTKMVNGTGEAHTSHSASKGTSNSATDQKAKMAASKPKKGQMSAIEMFATKSSSSKPDKNSSDKPRDAKTVKDNEAGEAKPDSANKGGSMMSFFGKTTTAKKAPEKPGTTGNEKEASSAKSETAPEKPNQASESKKKKKRELSSEDEEEPLPPKISKVVKSNVEESKDLKGDKKKVEEKQSKQTGVTKSGKAGKKKAVINESDEEPEEKLPKKRRKRMKELPKEASSDDEQDVKNADSSKRIPSDQGSSRSVSPPPQQQPQQTENGTARRRKRTKKLKDKTYMNDEGFMVTEKVWENDSTDASDEELQITNPPVDENKPSPAKKPNKKTYADVKNKTAKQSSLTSFFKKS